MPYHDNINTLWLSLLGMKAWNWDLRSFRKNPDVFFYSKCFYLSRLVVLLRVQRLVIWTPSER